MEAQESYSVGKEKDGCELSESANDLNINATYLHPYHQFISGAFVIKHEGSGRDVFKLYTHFSFPFVESLPRFKNERNSSPSSYMVMGETKTS